MFFINAGLQVVLSRCLLILVIFIVLDLVLHSPPFHIHFQLGRVVTHCFMCSLLAVDTPIDFSFCLIRDRLSVSFSFSNLYLLKFVSLLVSCTLNVLFAMKKCICSPLLTHFHVLNLQIQS